MPVTILGAALLSGVVALALAGLCLLVLPQIFVWKQVRRREVDAEMSEDALDSGEGCWEWEYPAAKPASSQASQVPCSADFDLHPLNTKQTRSRNCSDPLKPLFSDKTRQPALRRLLEQEWAVRSNKNWKARASRSLPWKRPLMHRGKRARRGG